MDKEQGSQGQVEFSATQAEGKYGFVPGQAVKTPAGAAVVLGENNGELYFIVEGRGAPSYWSGHTKEDFASESFEAEAPSSVDKSIPLKQSWGSKVIAKMAELGVSIPLLTKEPGRSNKENSDIFLPIEIDEGKNEAIVLDTAIEMGCGGDLVPSPEKFRHFVLDDRTLTVIHTIAESVRSDDACLLMGDTGTSKTSSIEYLGMITEHEVVRVNLNGQTDTSELIGKFVPNDGEGETKFERLIANPDQMKSESREILAKAQAETRALTETESKQIAAIEELSIPSFRWVDGSIPTAMVKGQWLILDEVNLAEPQILERLNSVLEKFPSLVISEHEGEQIGPKGEQQVHPGFRIFATANPAEFEGRNALSPAFRDRFTSQLMVENPTEEQYSDMLELLVFGRHPIIQSEDIRFRGIQVEPAYPELNTVPHIQEVLILLAKFQIEIEKMARSKEIGKGQKEPYVFTRRGLMEVLEYMGQCQIVDRKNRTVRTINDSPKEIITRGIQKYYLNKMKTADDTSKVQDLLDAVGLSENSWSVGEKREASARENPESEHRIFKNPDGSTYESDGRTELSVWKLGARVYPHSVSIKPAILDADYIEIVGFTPDNCVVIECDNSGKTYKDSLREFTHRFTLDPNERVS
jgi:MoxR-like ATPase